MLAREQNRGNLAASKAEAFMTELTALNIVVVDESGARVFTEVHRIALAYRLTSYDAAYLELAIRKNIPLATLDADLIRAAQAAKVAVIGTA